jgi:succinate dehydrogenase / fumarate reductase cytochrome b subunit
MGGGALQFYRSTIGKKVIMAITGLVMIGFVIVHMLGNLQVFGGPARINAYSAFLHGTGELLWLIRAILLAAVILHIDAALSLTRIAHAARPIAYAEQVPQVSTLASRTMRWGGLLLAAFIVFHILHLTTGTVHPAFTAGDVYGNVVSGLRVWPVAMFYIVAMVALGLHLYHGTWSSARTLGVARPSANPLHRRLALVVALVAAVGFALVPVAVLAGWVR